jgi:hypothetical protein
MFTYDSNAEEVLTRLKKSLEKVESGLGTNLKIAAHDSLAIIANRVQQGGMNANGARMVTKSRLRSGAYSKRYSDRRSARGRQINIMDATMEGDLFRAWQVLDMQPREVTVGFNSDDQAKKAEHLEAQQGPIFNLSTGEQDKVITGIMDRAIEDLKY